MATPKNGATTVREDDKMYPMLLGVLAEYYPHPLFVIQEVFAKAKSVDLTILILDTSVKTEVAPMRLAALPKEQWYVQCKL